MYIKYIVKKIRLNLEIKTEFENNIYVLKVRSYNIIRLYKVYNLFIRVLKLFKI